MLDKVELVVLASCCVFAPPIQTGEWQIRDREGESTLIGSNCPRCISTQTHRDGKPHMPTSSSKNRDLDVRQANMRLGFGWIRGETLNTTKVDVFHLLFGPLRCKTGTLAHCSVQYPNILVSKTRIMPCRIPRAPSQSDPNSTTQSHSMSFCK